MLLSSRGHLVSIKCRSALIHSVTVDTLSIAMGCYKILESDGCNFLFNVTS